MTRFLDKRNGSFINKIFAERLLASGASFLYIAKILIYVGENESERRFEEQYLLCSKIGILHRVIFAERALACLDCVLPADSAILI